MSLDELRIHFVFVFRGSSFPSADQQVPFNGHFVNGGTSFAPDGMRSIHIKAHSEVTAADVIVLRDVDRNGDAVTL